METHAPSPGIPFIARSLGTHRPALSGAPSSCPGSPGVQGARQPQPHPRLLQVRHWILTPQLSLLEPESELVTALGPWHLTFPASPSSSFTLYLGDPFLEGGVPGPPSLSAPCRLILRGSFHSCSEIVTCTVRLADVWSLRGVPASVLASGTADGLPARLVSRLLEGFSQLVGAGSQHCPCRSPDLGRCLTPEARGSSWPVSRLSGLRVHIGRMETELPCSRASGGLRDEQRINEQQVGSPPVTLPPGWGRLAGALWEPECGRQTLCHLPPALAHRALGVQVGAQQSRCGSCLWQEGRPGRRRTLCPWDSWPRVLRGPRPGPVSHRLPRLSPQSTVPELSYLSVMCVFAYISGHSIGPSEYLRARPPSLPGGGIVQGAP